MLLPVKPELADHGDTTLNLLRQYRQPYSTPCTPHTGAKRRCIERSESSSRIPCTPQHHTTTGPKRRCTEWSETGYPVHHSTTEWSESSSWIPRTSPHYHRSKATVPDSPDIASMGGIGSGGARENSGRKRKKVQFQTTPGTTGTNGTIRDYFANATPQRKATPQRQEAPLTVEAANNKRKLEEQAAIEKAEEDSLLDLFVDKSSQRSDWRLLKEDKDLQEYAALDSHLHLRLYRKLVQLLEMARRTGIIPNPSLKAGSKVQITYRNQVCASGEMIFSGGANGEARKGGRLTIGKCKTLVRIDRVLMPGARPAMSYKHSPEGVSHFQKSWDCRSTTIQQLLDSSRQEGVVIASPTGRIRALLDPADQEQQEVEQLSEPAVEEVEKRRHCLPFLLQLQ